MKKRILIAGLALLAGLGGVGTAKAQPEMYGRVILAPYFDTSHMSLFSQNDFFYGTSRSAAMGGAFTSLGADLSSININPAGLGMYQSSDWGITQALSINTMATSAKNMSPGMLTSGGSRVSYGLNNVGMAYNLFNRSGTLTSMTFGFSYNRVANFNSHTSVRTLGESSSIVEMFHNQMNYKRLPFSEAETADPFYYDPPILDYWGAILGYHTWLLGDDGTNYTIMNGLVPADSYFRSVTKGGIYEYDFSLGANISNIVYIGATLGATHINYREENSYGEGYEHADVGGMEYTQDTRISGTGLTAKLGVIARPLPALRVGVALHLPTFYSVDKSYSSVMESGEHRKTSGDPLVDKRSFTTAPRLLTGVSYVIADRIIVALDYDVAWYGMIHDRTENSIHAEESKSESRGLYKAAHSLRAGVEVSLSDRMSFRAGGGYKFDFMEDKHFLSYGNPAPKSGYHLSAGVGFNIGRNGYIDLTYLFNRQNYTDYDYYYYNDGVNIVSQYDKVGDNDYDRAYSQRRNHHMITLTFGSRF